MDKSVCRRVSSLHAWRGKRNLREYPVRSRGRDCRHRGRTDSDLSVVTGAGTAGLIALALGRLSHLVVSGPGKITGPSGAAAAEAADSDEHGTLPACMNFGAPWSG